MRADAAALTQERLSAVQEWAQAQLDLGRVSEVLAVLRRETADHPRRERLHALLMLALYRAAALPGRSARALRGGPARARRRARAGAGPGLRELQQRILRQDPSLEAAPAAGARAGAVRGAAARPPLALAAVAGLAVR